MIQNTSNYGKARQYYQKASHIDTRNAKPFNQLAILAWTAKRKFEAVYYHMRCLQTKSPVESSRQSLIEIFEDIRKRWEISEKKRLEERAQRKKEADSERDRMHLIKGIFFLQKFDFTEKYFHLDIILYYLLRNEIAKRSLATSRWRPKAAPYNLSSRRGSRFRGGRIERNVDHGTESTI